MSTQNRIPVSIHFPPDLHKAGKALAEQRHTSLGAVVRQALQDYVGRQNDGVNLTPAEASVDRLERALDRVLVDTIRIGDRLRNLTTA